MVVGSHLDVSTRRYVSFSRAAIIMLGVIRYGSIWRINSSISFGGTTRFSGSKPTGLLPEIPGAEVGVENRRESDARCWLFRGNGVESDKLFFSHLRVDVSATSISRSSL